MGCIQDKDRLKVTEKAVEREKLLKQKKRSAQEEYAQLIREKKIALETKRLVERERKKAEEQAARERVIRDVEKLIDVVPPPLLKPIHPIPSAPLLERLSSSVLDDDSEVKVSREYTILVDQSRTMNTRHTSALVRFIFCQMFVCAIVIILLVVIISTLRFFDVTLLNDALSNYKELRTQLLITSLCVWATTITLPFISTLEQGAGYVVQVGLAIAAFACLLRQLFSSSAPSPSRTTVFLSVVLSGLFSCTPSLSDNRLSSKQLIATLSLCFFHSVTCVFFTVNWTPILISVILLQMKLTSSYTPEMGECLTAVGGVCVACLAQDIIMSFCNTESDAFVAAGLMVGVLTAILFSCFFVFSSRRFDICRDVVRDIVKHTAASNPHGVTLHFCRESNNKKFVTYENVSSMEMVEEISEGKLCYGESTLDPAFVTVVHDFMTKKRKPDSPGQSIIIIADCPILFMIELMRTVAPVSRDCKGPEELTVTMVQVGDLRNLQHVYKNSSKCKYEILNFVLASDVLAAETHQQFASITSPFHGNSKGAVPSAPPLASPLGGPSLIVPAVGVQPVYSLFDKIPRMPASFQIRSPLKKIPVEYLKRKYVLIVDSSHSMQTASRNQLLYKFSLLLVCLMWLSTGCILVSLFAYLVGSKGIISRHAEVAKFWVCGLFFFLLVHWVVVEMPKTKGAVARQVARRMINHIFDKKSGGSGLCDLHYGVALYDITKTGALGKLGKRSSLQSRMSFIIEQYENKFRYDSSAPTSFIIITDFSNSSDLVSLCQRMSQKATSPDALSFTFVHCHGNLFIKSAHVREVLSKNPSTKCKYKISSVVDARDINDKMTFSQFIQMQMPSERMIVSQ